MDKLNMVGGEKTINVWDVGRLIDIYVTVWLKNHAFLLLKTPNYLFISLKHSINTYFHKLLYKGDFPKS